MVTTPVAKAESAFRKGAVFSGTIIVVLFGTVVVASMLTNTVAPEDARENGNAPAKTGTVETQPNPASGQSVSGQHTKPQSPASKPKVDPDAKVDPGPARP